MRVQAVQRLESMTRVRTNRDRFPYEFAIQDVNHCVHPHDHVVGELGERYIWALDALTSWRGNGRTQVSTGLHPRRPTEVTMIQVAGVVSFEMTKK